MKESMCYNYSQKDGEAYVPTYQQDKQPYIWEHILAEGNANKKQKNRDGCIRKDTQVDLIFQ